MVTLTLPNDHKKIRQLIAGQKVLINGCIFTARDAAHKCMCETIKKGKEKPLPINLAEVAIYYCGPTPERKGDIIGSCGPTTASRMDDLTEPLLNKGLRIMIGKGDRSDAMRKLIKKYTAVYCTTYGGCGAYLRQHILKKELVAYEDLGPEAIYKLTVENFPVIVAIDSRGRSLFNALSH